MSNMYYVMFQLKLGCGQYEMDIYGKKKLTKKRIGI